MFISLLELLIKVDGNFPLTHVSLSSDVYMRNQLIRGTISVTCLKKL